MLLGFLGGRWLTRTSLCLPWGVFFPAFLVGALLQLPSTSTSASVGELIPPQTKPVTEEVERFLTDSGVLEARRLWSLEQSALDLMGAPMRRINKIHSCASPWSNHCSQQWQ